MSRTVMPVANEKARRGPGRESFFIVNRVFDVTLAKERAARTHVGAHGSINVEEAAELFGLININHDHAMTTDLTSPVLVATVKLEGACYSLPIDGWHRIYKAHRLGVKELPSITFSLQATYKLVVK